MDKGHISLLDPRPAGWARATSGHLLCRHFSMMAPYRLRRGASPLLAWRSRQNATFVHYQALNAGSPPWTGAIPFQDIDSARRGVFIYF